MANDSEAATGSGRAADPDAADRVGSVVRHEEELVVDRRPVDLGGVRARKVVETQAVEQDVDRQVDDADIERVTAEEGDSGEIETLADGSVSIPVFEEELVITKRLVVRERVIVRKRSETQTTRVQADLRRERVEVEADPGIDVDGE
jgi:uncharacterized protein (TIGR02271 family)